MQAGRRLSRFKQVGVLRWKIRADLPRCDDDCSSEREAADTMLPGKASKLQSLTDRTENRHWWAR